MHRKGLVFVQQDGGEQDVIEHVLLDTGGLAVIVNADVVMVQSVTQKQVHVFFLFIFFLLRLSSIFPSFHFSFYSSSLHHHQSSSIFSHHNPPQQFLILFSFGW